jgi:hypothetical protein
MVSQPSGQITERFSLVVGGPFHAGLRRLRLTGADQLPTRRAALLLSLVAWAPPAGLAIAQALSGDHDEAWLYFTDLTVYARFVIAIAVMVATERYADGRVILLTRQFKEAQLIGENGGPGLVSALDAADRRSSSAIAELVILLVALGWSVFIARYTVEISTVAWEGRSVNGQVVLSWAGAAAAFLGNPLFLFLALRWIWRFIVWATLLNRIARLPLQLAPTHPDRCAGLGFLAIFPSIFIGFVFALSCVISASMLKEIGVQEVDGQVVWLAITVWIVLCLVLVLGPLLVFVRPLYLARERALLDYGRLASRHHLAFQRKWIGGPEAVDADEASGDPNLASSLSGSVAAARSMRVLPLERMAVMQLAIAAALPMLAVVSTQVPLMDIAKWIFGKIV